MKTSVIYARVSSETDRQDTTRQVNDLTKYATFNDLTISKVFTEHISGAKKNADRPVLCDCLDYCITNKINTLLVSELSRLGRNPWEVNENVKRCIDHNINIYFQKEGLSCFTANGKPNPFLPIFISVLGTFAQMERENIQFRLNSGRQQYINNGGQLGRKQGSTKSKAQMEEDYPQVIAMLKKCAEMRSKGVRPPKEYTIRGIAETCGVSSPTVQTIKKTFNL